MEAVWDVLGLTKTIASLTAQIASNKDRVLVRGKSGTGKTALAETLAEQLKAFEIYPLRLRGDIGRVGQEYYPFFNLLRSRDGAAPRDLLAAAADDLPAGSNLIKRAIDVVAAFVDSRRVEHAPPIHDPIAAEIVATLRGHVQRRKTLLVLDDVQAFDLATIKILDLIITSPERYLGKHGSRLFVLMTENTEENERNPEPIRERMLAPFRRVDITRCERERFADLLVALGFPPVLHSAALDDLFRRSGGHLRILAELARQITSSTETIDLYSRTDLLDLVLTLRLAEPGAVDYGIQSLLARIAILGTTFTRIEVQCLIDDRPLSELGAAIRKAMELSLLEGTGAVLSFQHASIREFFLRASPREKPRYHEIFCSCLRAIRPSDYASRILHLHSAGRDGEADILRVLQWARGSRNGRRPDLPVFEVTDHSEFVAALSAAYERIRSGNYTGAVTVLEAMHEAYPDELLVERDLTLAECYLEHLEHEKFDRALQLLVKWNGRLGGELELRARVLFLEGVGWALKAEYVKSEEVLTKLMHLLAPVRQTDPELQRVLNRVQLVGDCTQKIELSGRRIYSALESLQNARLAGRPFNPLDLFVALTNYSGNQILTGEYAEAARSAAAASHLQSEYQEIVFPSPVPALNNHLIADLLSARSTPRETLEGFAALMNQVDQPNDRVLVAANYANVLSMSGEAERAVVLLEDLRAALQERGPCDEYYIFYTDHSLAAAHVLSGNRQRARALWDMLNPLMTKLPPGLQEYLPHRHRLLGRALDDRAVTEPRHWSEYIKQSPPFRGRPWRFFQNGFLFSDIQIWFRF